MASQPCTLCDLETPNPPITDDDVDGVFCCNGCLQVYQLLGDLDEEEAETLRKKTIARRRKEKESKNPLSASNKETFFRVEGMHCSTCEAFLETLAERKDGIIKCEASYASEMLKVCYDPTKLGADDISSQLSSSGYRVQPMGAEMKSEKSDQLARLVIGIFFGIIGLLIYGLFLYPMYINGQGFISITQEEQLFFLSNIFVMTTFVLFYTGFPILRGAWVSISLGQPNMDLLIGIAALSAYTYSTIAILQGSAEVYFDVSMAIIIVVTAGNYYEQKIKSGRQNILSELDEKRQKTARVKIGGKFTNKPINEIEAGDQILIKKGERIPIDGIITEGNGVINEALMTGESNPVSKHPGDRVISGTILTQNALIITVDQQVKSTVDELMRLMWNIQSSRPGKLRLADRIAGYFVPAVLLLGAATFGVQMLTGTGTNTAVLSSLAVLIVSCPCALGLATPLAISSGIKSGLANDVIFKTSSIFESQEKKQIIAFDKTGTLTTGRMHLLDKGENDKALEYAAALEQRSSHPIAVPIANSIKEPSPKIVDFETHTHGVKGKILGNSVWVGKPEWLIKNGFNIKNTDSSKVQKHKERGHIPVAVGWDEQIKSILVVGDYLRDNAKEMICLLKDKAYQIAIITGDSEQAGRHIEHELQPDFLFTEVRPESKSKILKELRKMGTIIMVGDGSNDAPALAEADLGIAFGDITAIAAESAQVVIPDEQLNKIPAALHAISLTKRRIRQNLGWAFLYNGIAIPLAVTGWINPLFAAIAMAASSLLVVINSSLNMKLTAFAS